MCRKRLKYSTLCFVLKMRPKSKVLEEKETTEHCSVDGHNRAQMELCLSDQSAIPSAHLLCFCTCNLHFIFNFLLLYILWIVCGLTFKPLPKAMVKSKDCSSTSIPYNLPVAKS